MTRSSAANSGYATRSSTGRKGGRRPREIEDKDQYNLSEEDKEKRNKRRERNKQAAARCRQRRMDLMDSLQEQVDKLKTANQQKELEIARLAQRNQEFIDILSQHHHHDCKLQMKAHQVPTNEEQQRAAMLMYNHGDMMRHHQQAHMKLDPDNQEQQQQMQQHNDLEPLYNTTTATTKEDVERMCGASGDRSSPMNDYPITTCTMITNNDPVISHAFQSSTESGSKRAKLNQSPMISDPNDGPTFSRPNTLTLGSTQYGSAELGNTLPSLNTPSSGLGNFSGEFSLLNQQTFLTPMTLGPIPVTSANTPPHGDLRQL